MPGLSLTGFQGKSLDEIKAAIAAAMHATISTTLDTSEGSLIGALITSVSRQIHQVWEVAETLHASQDPDEATGSSLTAIGALTGSVRSPATPTRVTASCTLAKGTYPAGSLVAYVSGDPTKRFENEEDVVSLGGTVTGITFVAQATGPLEVAYNTLTQIATPVAGWTFVNNPSGEPYSEGTDVETDDELRERRVTELARRGSSTVDAVRADVLQVPGVTFCAVYENVTDTTDGAGRPPHSLEVVVLGGANQDVVDAILATRPAGVATYGTSSLVAVNAQGHEVSISYSRPTPVTIYIDMDITAIDGQYGGDFDLRQSIVDYAEDNLSVGHDVIRARLVALALAYRGVIDAVIRVGIATNPSGTSNVVIGPREYAQVLIGTVQVETLDLVPGPP